ncbi:MAG TPA: TMEM175 family protein [Thermoplasmata archaeon]|nr:TMEM175 family protein [Thermoplasmata archaeon]
MSARGGSVAGLGKARVEALTDGIFSAVMTVLGLSLTIPYITGPAQQQLPAYEDILTAVLTYALSFVTLGVFWFGHHVGFQIVKRTDRTFIWLNNSFLLFVGLLPLTTALLGHHPLEQVTIVAYGLNLLAIQSAMYLTLWYATYHHHLVEAGLNDRFIWLARRRLILGPAFSAAAVLLAFLDPVVSLAAYVLYPAFFIVPGRIDRLWRRQEVR